MSLEELENQSGHLVCPQCLAEIDVDVNLFNGNTSATPDYDDTTVTPERQAPPSHTTPPPMPSTAAIGNTHQEVDTDNSPAQPPHIDDVMRYCKHCGAFLREGVNFCPKCGKYVRVSAPPNFNAPTTAAQHEADKLRASSPPAQRIPPNKQSTYKPPQEPSYQGISVKQQRTYNTARNGARRRTDSGNKNNNSKFSIHSPGGCLTVTIIAVALFFIIYIIIGMTTE